MLNEAFNGDYCHEQCMELKFRARALHQSNIFLILCQFLRCEPGKHEHASLSIKRMWFDSFRRSQVGVIVISSRLPPLRPGIMYWACAWVEICRSQFDFEGFAVGTPVFLPLQIRLSGQDLSRRAIKCQPLANI